MHIKLITHASHIYGLGHLSRSRVIAEQFIDNGYGVEIVELDVALHLVQALDRSLHEQTLIVIDLDPRFWEALYQTFRNYILEKGSLTAWHIFIFDDPRFMVRNLIARSFENVTYLNPYQDKVAQFGSDTVSGFNYFPFTKYLLEIRERNLEYFSFSQIAITCGGSDPHGLTNTYLNLLNLYNEEILNVSIFIGPLFDTNNISTLKQEAYISMHKIDFVTQEEYSATLFEKSGLVLTTGGLTRYELALCGIPFVTLNFDPVQDVTSNMFEKNGASIHLGQHSQRQSNLRRNFHNSLKKILAHEDVRIEMGRRGRNLFNKSDFNLAARMVNLMNNAR